MYCPKCATLQSDDQKFCRSCGMNLEIIGEVITNESSADEFRAISDAKTRHKKRKNRLENLGGLVIMLSLLTGCLIPLVVGLSYLMTISSELLEALILILAGVAGIFLFGGISLAIYGDIARKSVETENSPNASNQKDINELNQKNVNELSPADNFQPAASVVENTTRNLETNKIKRKATQSD